MTPADKFILLADDDAVVAELVLHTLATFTPAPRVVLVRDGADAMDFLCARGEYARRPPVNPAVVLLDVNMPRLNGIEVLRQVKSHHSLRTIPVIMLTSSQDEKDISQSYLYGANAYVVKPLEFPKFAFVLRHLETFWMKTNHPPPGRGSGSVAANPLE